MRRRIPGDVPRRFLHHFYARHPSGLSSFNKVSCLYGTTKLVGGNRTAFDGSKVSADYAVIDTADTPGYLTAG